MECGRGYSPSLEDESGADASVFHVQADLDQFIAAGVDGCEPVLEGARGCDALPRGCIALDRGLQESLCGEDELIERRALDVMRAATLADGCGDAASGNAGCEQAQRLVDVIPDMRDGIETGSGPENTREPGEGGVVEREKAFDGSSRRKDGREEARGVGLFARGGQQALEEPAKGLMQQGVAGGQARVGEERDRVELGEHGLPGGVEVGAKLPVLLKQADEAQQRHDEAAIGRPRPDISKEAGCAAGTGAKRGGVAESQGAIAEAGVGQREG